MSKISRKLRIQQLESRRMMAVMADEVEADNGTRTLVLTGDQGAVPGPTTDFVEVRRASADPETGDNRFRVTANFDDDDTTVERRTFTDIDRFAIFLENAADTVRFNNIRGRDNVDRITINMGRGDDLVTLDNVTAGSINILTGNDADSVFLSGVTTEDNPERPGDEVAGRTRIRAGRGDDSVNVGFTAVFTLGDDAVAPGDEEATVPTAADLLIAGPAEEAEGVDVFEFILDSSGGTIVEGIGGDADDDTVSLANSIFGTVDIFLGIQNDTIDINGNEFLDGGTIDGGDGAEGLIPTVENDTITGEDNSFTADDDPAEDEEDETEGELLIVNFETVAGFDDTGVTDEAEQDGPV